MISLSGHNSQPTRGKNFLYTILIITSCLPCRENVFEIGE